MTPLYGQLQDIMLEGVLSVIAPRTPLAPMVFDSPHSGLDMPRGFPPCCFRRASESSRRHPYR